MLLPVGPGETPPSSTMQLTPMETHINVEVPTPMNADLNLYGFPPGYFVIRSVASGRLLDVEMGWNDDGTQLILYTENEKSLVDSECYS